MRRTGVQARRLSDATALRYETLRGEFLTLGMNHPHADWERFCACGLVGLLRSEPSSAYVVEVYRAPVRRWWGRTDPEEQALREAFRLVIGNAMLTHADPGAHHDEFVMRCTA